MENKETIKPTGCCPIFDPSMWDGKEFTWNNKPFVIGRVKSFMHIPLNMGQMMTKTMEQIRTAGAAPADKDFVMLSLESSPWYSDHYLSVTKPVEGMNNTKLSGTFMTKVFEGPYQDAKKWHKEMISYVESKGRQVKKIYFYYTTCPKCAKAYGKNYVVGFAEV